MPAKVASLTISRVTGISVRFLKLNITEAYDYYNRIWFDGLFDKPSLSLTLEIMFYNENYQTGVIMIYEFLINNSAKVEKHKNIEAFYLSRYNNNFRAFSQTLKNFLFLLDLVYLIHILFLTYR